MTLLQLGCWSTALWHSHSCLAHAARAACSSCSWQVEECFSLSASAFHLTYTDDDGEEYTLLSDPDLSDAISYFVSGDDGEASYTSMGGTGRGYGLTASAQKITLRLDVIVEYDGPSLSDMSSVSSYSFQSGPDGDGASVSGSTHSGWRSSGYSSSYRSYARSTLGQEIIDEGEEGYSAGGDGESEYDSTYGSVAYGRPLRREFGNDQDQDELAGSPASDESGSPPDSRAVLTSTPTPHRRSQRIRAASQYSSSRQGGQGESTSAASASGPSSNDTPMPADTTATDTTPLATGPTLTGPESEQAPSLLTHSELGSRWLREQSKLAKTRRNGHNSSSRRYDSDDETIDSDDESLGDLELVRDARGSECCSSCASL